MKPLRGPAPIRGTNPIAPPNSQPVGPGVLSAPMALVAGAPKPPTAPGIQRPRRTVVARAKQVMRPKRPKMPGVESNN